MIGKADENGNFNTISKNRALDLARISIDECGFSVRTMHVFKRCEIHNCLEAALKSEDDYMKVKNCGKNTLNEIKRFFYEKGIENLPVYVPDLNQIDIDKVAPKPDDLMRSKADIIEKIKYVNIAETNLSIRSKNCCARANIITLYDFAILQEEKILSIKNFGKRSLKEVKELIKSYGVPYPLENIDLSELKPSIQYTGISKNSVKLLLDKNIIYIDDLNKLDDKEFNDLLRLMPFEDRNVFLYFVCEKLKFAIEPIFVNDFVEFVIQKTTEIINPQDVRLIGLYFGLFGYKKWSKETLSSTLCISVESLDFVISKIVEKISDSKLINKFRLAFDYVTQNDVKTASMNFLSEICK